MQDKNFSGQDLRGRSFKNQDLTGADFSDCDLRGVDFSGANLTTAKFCGAKMGKMLQANFSLLLLQLLLGMLGGFLSTVGNVFVFGFVDNILKLFEASTNENQTIFLVCYNLAFVLICFISAINKRVTYILCFFTLVFIGMLIVAIAENFVGAAGGIVAIIAAEIIAGFGIIFVAIAGGRAVAVALVGAVIVAVVSATAKTVPEEIDAVIVALVTSGILRIILGFYLGLRAIKKEESSLLFIRNLSLKMRCFGGTQFAFAILQKVNFNNADFKYARFKKAYISGCLFHNVKNHHFSLTNETPLETRKIRDLVIASKITDKNFSQLDLRGLVFSGLNLEDFDFSHANLCGTDLSHTQMTGATLESWNIDTETDLNDIDCKYYYYLEDGEKKRMPPEGEDYKQGEFSRIFQKIAHTIDFIAHNETELAAIKLSVEQVKVESGNDEIRIQAIEEKDGFIIVKVNAPKTEDRGVLYHEVNSLIPEYKTKIQALTADNYTKIGNIESLKEQLREQRDDFLATIKQQNLIQIEHHEGEIIMSEDNSRHFSGNNNNNVNLGDNSTLTNTISQLPESDNNLKELLTKLSGVIEQSKLPDEDKQDALEETKTIAEAREQEPEQQKSIVSKALRALKRMSGDLQDAPEILEQYSEIIEQIGEVF